MSENVEFFGIRHLSPAGAFELKKRLDKAKPDLILVEGPSDLNEMQKWICDKETKFPIAIMSYTTTAPVQSLLYPFAIYSPEIQAILWANNNNVECKFMDLPSSTFLAFQRAEEERMLNQEISDKEDLDEISKSSKTIEENTNSTTENIYQKLEIVTGENHESFWERNFEQLGGTGEYQEASNAFGRELRSLAVDEKMETAETLVREAFMKRQIEDAIKSGKQKIFCVCGSFHVSGLENNVAMTDEELAKLPKEETNATLMPYNYSRLSNLSGYGAGNKAPSYYEMLWDAMNKSKLSEFTENYLVSVASEHRKSGNIVSSAEVIEAARLARTISSLRGNRIRRKKIIPTLDDLHDSVISAMGHGEFSEFVEAFVKVEIKNQFGKLPKTSQKTPVQEDFYRQLEELDLTEYKKEENSKIELDLRENLRVKDRFKAFKDLYRSFFFNRLKVLEVEFATKYNINQENGSWKEVWDVKYTPETEIQIIESSILGETIAASTKIKLCELARESTSISQASEVFEKAVFCGLPECAVYILKVLENLSVDDAAVLEIANCATRISNIIRYGDLRQFDTSKLPNILLRLYLRYCLIIEESCVCSDKAEKAVIESMELMSKVQLNHDFLAKNNDFVNVLEKISNRDDLSQKCSGFAMALLIERGEADEQLLLQELSRRLSPGTPADLGASWFEGLSKKNHYSLIARLSLWRQLSDYVQNLDEEEFKRTLVFLRRAFADYNQNEKVEIAENLGEIWNFNSSQVGEILTKKLTEEETQQINEDLGDFDFGDI